jgi:hypothetical protein
MRSKKQTVDVQLNSPEYNEAWSEILHMSINALVVKDPVIELMGHVTTEHNGPTRNVRTPVTVDTPMCDAEFKAGLSIDDIRATKIEAQTVFVFNMFESLMGTVGPHIYGTICSITEATGMMADAQGKPLSSEMILRSLEELEYDFDDDGQPKLPALVTHPDMRERAEQALHEAELDPRYNEILLRKRNKYFAEKRTRRLS